MYAPQHGTLTLSFSCVSRIVFPSAFFLQLCPSRRKKRVAFRLNRNSVPPASSRGSGYAPCQQSDAPRC